ncbi:MAG: hypothetical protein WAZ18_03200 [Alphaproteobacteria bacterium]
MTKYDHCAYLKSWAQAYVFHTRVSNKMNNYFWHAHLPFLCAAAYLTYDALVDPTVSGDTKLLVPCLLGYFGIGFLKNHTLKIYEAQQRFYDLNLRTASLSKITPEKHSLVGRG